MEDATSRTLASFAPEYRDYLDLSDKVFFDHYGNVCVLWSSQCFPEQEIALVYPAVYIYIYGDLMVAHTAIISLGTWYLVSKFSTVLASPN